MGKSFFNEIGRTPAEIDAALREFSRSAEVFSSNRPRLIDKYENKWIGVYKGKVEAVADSLEDLTRQIDAKDIPSTETIVRHIDREERTFIL